MYEFFEKEINLIQSEDMRMFTKWYLDEKVPKYFWEIGASSSGKFHPQFSQGVGGLVRHTKAVVLFAEELLRMSSYAYMKEEYKDYVILACIVHDTCKYGKVNYDKTEYSAHARNAADLVYESWVEYYGENPSEFLLNAIVSHMGQWTENKDERPFTSVDRCVHMADYMASRSFIDIPQIVDEYKETADRLSALAEEEVPFLVD